MNSSSSNPLSFFESFINQGAISEEIDKQLEFSDGVGIHYINEFTIGFHEQNMDGEFNLVEIPVKDILESVIHREVNKTKNHLYNYSISHPKEVIEQYLNVQHKIILGIATKQMDVLTKYPYLIYPLNNILEYINQHLLIEGMSPFKIEEEAEEPREEVAIEAVIEEPLEVEEIVKIIKEIVTDEKPSEANKVPIIDEKPTVDIEQPKTDDVLIESIFGYMKGQNEKRKDILSAEDYSLLIKYTKHLIDEESIPQFAKQIQPNISNDLIRFSYWVLHKEIYTTKVLRSYFYDFIKGFFVSFKENEINSIKSQFGTKSRVPKDKFLPTIIENYL